MCMYEYFAVVLAVSCKGGPKRHLVRTRTFSGHCVRFGGIGLRVRGLAKFSELKAGRKSMYWVTKEELQYNTHRMVVV